MARQDKGKDIRREAADKDYPDPFTPYSNNGEENMLWRAVKDILDNAGYDIATIEHDLILNHSNMATKQSLPVVGLCQFATRR